MVFLLLLACLISLCAGSVHIEFKNIFSPGIEHSIIFDIRLPRVFLAIVIGGALSTAGVIFQGLFRNPLVEPYTLGISGGAALFVSFSVVFGLNLILPLAGFTGALISIIIIYFISRKDSRVMLLAGVMISFISASAVMFVMAVSGTEELHSIIYWIMGNLGEADKGIIMITSFFILAGVVLSIFYSNSMNAMMLGEEGAMHLGINVERIRKMLFVIASLITGCCVSMSGIIGFVGLVVPHFMRIFFGSDHRILIIASFLGGGIFLLLCDTVARTIIQPMELPVGVVTGIVGGTAFIYFLSRRKERCWK